MSPANSKKQQEFMGIVHAIQEGKQASSGQAGKTAKTMKPSDVTEFASTKRKSLPVKVSKNKKKR